MLVRPYLFLGRPLIYISKSPLVRPFICHFRLLTNLNVPCLVYTVYTFHYFVFLKISCPAKHSFASRPLNISQVCWSQNSKSYILNSCGLKLVGNKNLSDRQRQAFAFIFCRQKDKILWRNVLHEEAELGQRMFFPKVNIGRVKTIPWSLNNFEVNISDVTFLPEQYWLSWNNSAVFSWSLHIFKVNILVNI